jgi:benzoate/toluate 1,2-dioxygenase reductase subunit
MAYRIVLNFEDGATRFIDCNAGEKVLDAAYRQKINLPMNCSDGVCGACKCRCEQGDYDLGDDYLEDALSPQEAAEGLVLTCQMQVASDCIIAVPVPASSCKLTPARHGGTVVSVVPVSDSTFVLTLELDTPASIDFLPGQYVNLEVPGTSQHRAYSFSSAPGARQATFLIRNIPGGVMSGWLDQTAAPGARIGLVGPYGSFFLRQTRRPVVMLAGGTGLAPLLSMLEALAEQGVQHSVHLIYGVTRDGDLVEIPRLERLSRRLPTLTWSTCVADPQSAHPLKGYVTEHLAEHHLNAGDCDVYLCGPPAMVEAVRQFFQTKGLAPAAFHYEKFAPSEAA